MANVVDLGLGLILAHQVHEHVMIATNTARSKTAKDALSGTRDHRVATASGATQQAVPNLFGASMLRGPVLTRI